MLAGEPAPSKRRALRGELQSRTRLECRAPGSTDPRYCYKSLLGARDALASRRPMVLVCLYLLAS